VRDEDLIPIFWRFPPCSAAELDFFFFNFFDIFFGEKTGEKLSSIW